MGRSPPPTKRLRRRAIPLFVTEIYAHLAPGRNRFRRESVFDIERLEDLLAVRPPGEGIEMPPKGEPDEARPAGAV